MAQGTRDNNSPQNGERKSSPRNTAPQRPKLYDNNLANAQEVNRLLKNTMTYKAGKNMPAQLCPDLMIEITITPEMYGLDRTPETLEFCKRQTGIAHFSVGKDGLPRFEDIHVKVSGDLQEFNTTYEHLQGRSIFSDGVKGTRELYISEFNPQNISSGGRRPDMQFGSLGTTAMVDGLFGPKHIRMPQDKPIIYLANLTPDLETGVATTKNTSYLLNTADRTLKIEPKVAEMFAYLSSENAGKYMSALREEGFKIDDFESRFGKLSAYEIKQVFETHLASMMRDSEMFKAPEGRFQDEAGYMRGNSSAMTDSFADAVNSSLREFEKTRTLINRNTVGTQTKIDYHSLLSVQQSVINGTQKVISNSSFASILEENNRVFETTANNFEKEEIKAKQEEIAAMTIPGKETILFDLEQRAVSNEMKLEYLRALEDFSKLELSPIKDKTNSDVTDKFKILEELGFANAERIASLSREELIIRFDEMNSKLIQNLPTVGEENKNEESRIKAENITKTMAILSRMIENHEDSITIDNKNIYCYGKTDELYVTLDFHKAFKDLQSENAKGNPLTVLHNVDINSLHSKETCIRLREQLVEVMNNTGFYSERGEGASKIKERRTLSVIASQINLEELFPGKTASEITREDIARESKHFFDSSTVKYDLYTIENVVRCKVAIQLLDEHIHSRDYKFNAEMYHTMTNENNKSLILKYMVEHNEEVLKVYNDAMNATSSNAEALKVLEKHLQVNCNLPIEQMNMLREENNDFFTHPTMRYILDHGVAQGTTFRSIQEICGFTDLKEDLKNPEKCAEAVRRIDEEIKRLSGVEKTETSLEFRDDGQLTVLQAYRQLIIDHTEENKLEQARTQEIHFEYDRDIHLKVDYTIEEQRFIDGLTNSPIKENPYDNTVLFNRYHELIDNVPDLKSFTDEKIKSEKDFIITAIETKEEYIKQESTYHKLTENIEEEQSRILEKNELLELLHKNFEATKSAIETEIDVKFTFNKEDSIVTDESFKERILEAISTGKVDQVIKEFQEKYPDSTILKDVDFISELHDITEGKDNLSIIKQYRLEHPDSEISRDTQFLLALRDLDMSSFEITDADKKFIESFNSESVKLEDFEKMVEAIKDTEFGKLMSSEITRMQESFVERDEFDKTRISLETVETEQSSISKELLEKQEFVKFMIESSREEDFDVANALQKYKESHPDVQFLTDKQFIEQVESINWEKASSSISLETISDELAKIKDDPEKIASFMKDLELQNGEVSKLFESDLDKSYELAFLSSMLKDEAFVRGVSEYILKNDELVFGADQSLESKEANLAKIFERIEVENPELYALILKEAESDKQLEDILSKQKELELIESKIITKEYTLNEERNDILESISEKEDFIKYAIEKSIIADASVETFISDYNKEFQEKHPDLMLLNDKEFTDSLKEFVEQTDLNKFIKDYQEAHPNFELPEDKSFIDALVEAVKESSLDEFIEKYKEEHPDTKIFEDKEFLDKFVEIVEKSDISKFIEEYKESHPDLTILDDKEFTDKLVEAYNKSEIDKLIEETKDKYPNISILEDKEFINGLLDASKNGSLNKFLDEYRELHPEATILSDKEFLDGLAKADKDAQFNIGDVIKEYKDAHPETVIFEDQDFVDKLRNINFSEIKDFESFDKIREAIETYKDDPQKLAEEIAKATVEPKSVYSLIEKETSDAAAIVKEEKDLEAERPIAGNPEKHIEDKQMELLETIDAKEEFIKYMVDESKDFSYNLDDAIEAYRLSHPDLEFLKDEKFMEAIRNIEWENIDSYTSLKDINPDYQLLKDNPAAMDALFKISEKENEDLARLMKPDYDHVMDLERVKCSQEIFEENIRKLYKDNPELSVEKLEEIQETLIIRQRTIDVSAALTVDGWDKYNVPGETYSKVDLDTLVEARKENIQDSITKISEIVKEDRLDEYGKVERFSMEYLQEKLSALGNHELGDRPLNEIFSDKSSMAQTIVEAESYLETMRYREFAKNTAEVSGYQADVARIMEIMSERDELIALRAHKEEISYENASFIDKIKNVRNHNLEHTKEDIAYINDELSSLDRELKAISDKYGLPTVTLDTTGSNTRENREEIERVIITPIQEQVDKGYKFDKLIEDLNAERRELIDDRLHSIIEAKAQSFAGMDTLKIDSPTETVEVTKSYADGTTEKTTEPKKIEKPLHMYEEEDIKIVVDKTFELYSPDKTPEAKAQIEADLRALIEQAKLVETTVTAVQDKPLEELTSKDITAIKDTLGTMLPAFEADTLSSRLELTNSDARNYSNYVLTEQFIASVKEVSTIIESGNHTSHEIGMINHAVNEHAETVEIHTTTLQNQYNLLTELRAECEKLSALRDSTEVIVTKIPEQTETSTQTIIREELDYKIMEDCKLISETYEKYNDAVRLYNEMLRVATSAEAYEELKDTGIVIDGQVVVSPEELKGIRDDYMAASAEAIAMSEQTDKYAGIANDVARESLDTDKAIISDPAPAQEIHSPVIETYHALTAEELKAHQEIQEMKKKNDIVAAEIIETAATVHNAEAAATAEEIEAAEEAAEVGMGRGLEN